MTKSTPALCPTENAVERSTTMFTFDHAMSLEQTTYMVLLLKRRLKNAKAWRNYALPGAESRSPPL